MSNTEPESISDKMQRLHDMVAWFEGDEFQLEQAIDQYQRAETLAREIEAELAGLKNEITVLKQKFDS